MRIDEKWIRYVLTNNSRIKSQIEQRIVEVTDKKEKDIIKTIFSADYNLKKISLNCLTELYKDMTPFEREVMFQRFSLGYTSERVGYNVGYEKRTIERIVKKQKEKLYNMIKERVN